MYITTIRKHMPDLLCLEARITLQQHRQWQLRLANLLGDPLASALDGEDFGDDGLFAEVSEVEVVNSILEAEDGVELRLITSCHVCVSCVMVEEVEGDEGLDGVWKSVCHAQHLVYLGWVELHVCYSQVENVLLWQNV